MNNISSTTNNTTLSYEEKKTKHDTIDGKIQELRGQLRDTKKDLNEKKEPNTRVAYLTQEIKAARRDFSKANFTHKLKTAAKVAAYAFAAIAVISAVALAVTVPPLGIPALITTLLTASPLLGIPAMMKKSKKKIKIKKDSLAGLEESLKKTQKMQVECREKKAKITELTQEIAALKKEYNDFLATEQFLNSISKEDLAAIKGKMTQATGKEASQPPDAKLITPQKKGYGGYNNPYISTPVRSAPPTITITDPNNETVSARHGKQNMQKIPRPYQDKSYLTMPQPTASHRSNTHIPAQPTAAFFK